ncbi:MAG: T9SS type B sorting domain-containing protein, partial [Flavobacteriales bacterium]|nr:T9SS type B sorting domain-containing protein [Flavobacteriales bacterium]
GQCDPIEYDTFYSSQIAPVPPEIQTGEVECYSITQNFEFQVGAIWSTETIDLNNSFEYSYYVNLGFNDGGADGIVFVLSGDPLGQAAIGEPGGFLSYGGDGGISPSIALEFDTWNNGPAEFDIPNDHAMLHYNGVMDGSAGPAIDLGNIEDGEYHLVECIWDAVDDQLTILFDGTVLLDITVDLVNSVFGGNSQVLIGFTGSTGGFTNIQTVCDIQVIYTEECNGLDDDCDGIIDEDTEETYEQETFICEGESFTVGSSTYTVTGIYTDTMSSALGCDSIVITDLTVGEVITYMNEVQICDGEQYEIGSSVYTESGTYQDSFQNTLGCDSIIETILNVSPVYSIEMDVTICEGESYDQGDNSYSTSGTYTDVFESAAGCDSVIISHLEVLDVDTTMLAITLCEGEEYTTPVASYAVAGQYEEVYISTNSCDSLVQISIAVLPISTHSQQRYICTGGEFMVGDAVYTEQGVYVDTLQAANGCDSILSTTLGVIDELIIPDSALCDGQVFSLDMNPFPFHEIEGFDDVENGIYVFSDAGEGTVTVDLDGCVLSDVFHLDFIPNYSTESMQLDLCEEESLDLEGRDLDIDFMWTTGETSPVITVVEAGVYVKEYSYACGDFQDRFTVESLACNCNFYIPSAFTPDMDRLNDHFGIQYQCEFLSYELTVYDRFGNVLFQSTDPDAFWNGGVDGYYVPAGVYAYVLNYKALEKEGLTEGRSMGSITVIR